MIALICLLLLARYIVFLLLTRNYIVEENFLTLLLNISFTLFSRLQVLISLRVKSVILLFEPLVLEFRIIMLSLGYNFSSLMRVHGLLESLLSALLIYLQLADARLHHLVLALLLTLYQLHLELATGRLVLHAVD